MRFPRPRLLRAAFPILALGLVTVALPVWANPAGPAPRPVDVADVVHTRQITETRVSPDGRQAAVIVTEPSLADNTVTSRLLVLDLAAPDRARTVTTVTGVVERMTNLRWSPNGRELAFLAPLDGADEVWTVGTSGGKPRKLFDSPAPAVEFGGSHLAFLSPNVPPHAAKVLAFEWSPDGRTVAFTAPRPLAPATDQGVVYDERSVNIRTLISGEHAEVRNSLWLADTASRRTRYVVDSVQGPLAELSKPKMAFSPDSRRLAFVARGTQQPTDRMDRLHTVDVADLKVSTVDTGTARPLPPSWSPDSKTLAGFEGKRIVAIPADGGPRVPLATLPDRGVPGLARVSFADDKVIVSVRDSRRESPHVATVGATLAPIVSTTDDVSRCSFDPGLRHGVCIRQSAGTAPRLATVDIAGRALRDGHNPNGWTDGVRILPPVPVEWTNPSGLKATGYQIVPPGCGGGHRCPAVVITHGYDARNLFMAEQHEWSFPSQVYAARGYVVLLVNEPDYEKPVEDTTEARTMMEAAVRSGVDGGFIDPAKVGIMGYSRGARIADESMIHSTAFRVAVAGDDATVELMPGAGAPVAERFNGPLLQQMGPVVGVLATRVHEFLRRGLRVPAELVVFPDETHILHQPEHRAAAMRQNVDWVDYWLLDRRDPDPSKKDQYARWDALRQPR